MKLGDKECRRQGISHSQALLGIYDKTLATEVGYSPVFHDFRQSGIPAISLLREYYGSFTLLDSRN